MNSIEQLLSSNSLFAEFSAADRTRIAERALKRDYGKGELIAQYKDVWPYLLLVASGEVDLVKESAEGRNLIVTTLGPCEVFWGLAFFYEDVPSVVTLQAHSAARLYVWSRQTLLPMLLENGRATWELCRTMVRRMQRASEILGELAFQPVAARVARVLLDHYAGVDSTRVKRDLTLDEIAARAGTTREMVCRALYSFSDKGLIEITRTEFVLTDKKALSAMSGPA